jgi:hypothetical protein
LNSGQVRPFLPQIDARFELLEICPFNLSPDGRQFVFAHAEQSLSRIFSIDVQEPKRVRPLLALTSPVRDLDLDSAADPQVTETELRATLMAQSSPHRTRAIAAFCEDSISQPLGSQVRHCTSTTRFERRNDATSGHCEEP